MLWKPSATARKRAAHYEQKENEMISFTFPLGPLINASAIVAGSLAGLAVGARFPEKIRNIVFQGLGLCTLALGMQMAFASKEPVIMIFSVLLGGIGGESMDIESHFMRFGDKLKARLRSADPRFTEGLVSASILFCIGAMSILGSFDEGLRGDRSVVFSKAILDAFAATALASAYGLGVMFAAVPVLLYQGVLVLFAGLLQPWLGAELMAELTATGGVLILGIGLNLLNLTQIRLTNFLPALPVALLLAGCLA